jgi:Ser/Thr protein kinase RdoA (MazF antagonist)
MSEPEDPVRRASPAQPPLEVIRRFLGDAATSVAIAPLGAGLINRTYRLDGAAGAFVLQGINPGVFPAPERIMANLARLGEAAADHPDLGVRLPTLAYAEDGLPYVRDADGTCWRLMECIEPSRTLQRLDSVAQATEVGRTLGRFHRLGALLDTDVMAVTLPGFHHTPKYLAALDAAAGETDSHADVADALSFINARREAVPVLEHALARGRTSRRLIHGDPKLDNLLFDPTGCRALCLIDLDTVQPGLLHHDIGDCLRSCCNRGGEAGDTGAGARFDVELCGAILAGYAEASSGLLSADELQLMTPAVRLIPLELGIRFLTDHLQGDRYFRVRYRGENLHKARRQLALVADIERQQGAIDAAVLDAFARHG